MAVMTSLRARTSYMPKYMPDASCVLYLPGQDDAYSSTIRDRSGQGNNGTIVGAVWTRNGKGLWYPNCDGDDYIEIGDTSTFKFLHGALDTAGFTFTIEFWMSLPIPEPDVVYGLVSTCFSAETEVGMDFYFDDRTAQGSRLLRGIITNGVSGQTIITWQSDNNAYPNDTDPHYIVLTYDQALGSNNLELYVDNVLKKQANKTGDTPSLANSRHELHIGSLGSEAVTIVGAIVLPRIHNRVLSAAEKTDRYRLERHLFGV